MRVVLAGNKERGAVALRALSDGGHEVPLVVVHAEAESGVVAEAATAAGLETYAPVDFNAPDAVERIRAAAPDVIVLAGYSQILRAEALAVAPYGVLNLHGGKLPGYRGSSPLNWALINGENEFGICVIQVDAGVDTGPVLAERTFEIGPDDTIADLQRLVLGAFPELLLDVLQRLAAGTLEPRVQDERGARYFPLRFPDDGLVLWDLLTAVEVHNRIRALTDPYPGAFTFHRGKRITLLRSSLDGAVVLGEPGRVYSRTERGALVCAADRCLWIESAQADDGGDALAAIARYDTLATVRAAAAAVLSG